jgi:YidC/Oxa1 family membrane protein insertase
MERRVLLAVFLSFLVLVIYQRLVGPPPVLVDLATGESVAAPSASAAATGAPPVGADTRSAVEAPRRDESITQPPSNPVSTLVADDRARDIVVEGDLVRAVFANRGAELVSWQLKSYADEGGGPVELVPAEVEPGQAWPFTLLVPDDPALTARLDEALFRPSLDRVRLSSDPATPATLVFEYEDSSGLRARKSFTFQASPEQPYVVGVSVSVTTTDGAVPVTLQWGPALGGVRAAASRLVFQQLPGAVVYGRAFEDGLLQDVDIYRESPSDVADRPTYEGELDFAGVDNHYFLVAALPGEGQSRVDFRAVSTVSVEHDLVAFNLAVGSDGAEVPIFIGPKDFDVLAAADADLVRAIDFGWLAVLVVPLHRTLKWIYGFVGNYGWSIIFLTVLINLVIFPLRHKSVTSMRKMSELQPEMKAIQARYADLKTTDPAKQKMNQEVMELYRRNGVNPASGCLPMLLTMPVLIAFYRLLSMAIEIRGAPFMLWITDLSLHDPFYITPVVMGASMVLQQRLQPTQADPMQAKIMMLMPVMFTFMFLWAPSGLVIYWLTSNVIGIGQQLVTNRIAGPTRARQVRPPAERQVKRAGAGAQDGGADTDPAAAAKQVGSGATRPTPKGKGTRRSRGKGGEPRGAKA